MSSRAHGQATLDPRHAVQLLPNSPSCGNQPAHISLTARRQRHAHHPDAATKHETPPGSTPRRRLTTPLDKQHYISAVPVWYSYEPSGDVVFVFESASEKIRLLEATVQASGS